MNISRTLLKNGIKEMISENEEYFKQNIEQALAVKLNDSIFAVRQEVANRLFEETQDTKPSEQLQEFVNFVQNFKPGKFSFKDSSILNITEKEKELLKDLFENLNAKNRDQMLNEIFASSLNFKQHIEFAQQTRKLQ